MKKGEKRMNREEFNQVIVESIQEHLGEGYKVSLSTNLKVNDVRKVAVKVDSEGCSISPLIYVDELYTQYERNESMEEVMNFVLELLFKQRITGPFIILQSSSEEVLLMKEDDNEMSIERLSDMVKEVNETQVEKQQWLGNSIYRFNRERHEIEVISRG